MTILLLILSFHGTTQTEIDSAETVNSFSIISLDNFNTLYRLYPNPINYYTSRKLDSVWVEATNAEINYLGNYRCEITPKVDDHTYCEITLKGKLNKKTVVIDQRSCRLEFMPLPQVYLGAHQIDNDLNELSDRACFELDRFFVKYPAGVYLDAFFKLDQFSISINGQEIITNGYVLSQEFKQAYFEAPEDSELRFNYFTISGSGGYTNKKIDYSVVFRKKTKARTYSIE